jgi:hypothetical protein
LVNAVIGGRRFYSPGQAFLVNLLSYLFIPGAGRYVAASVSQGTRNLKKK